MKCRDDIDDVVENAIVIPGFAPGIKGPTGVVLADLISMSAAL